MTAPAIGIALTDSNTIAAAVTAAVAPSIPAGSCPTTTAAATASAAPTLG